MTWEFTSGARAYLAAARRRAGGRATALRKRQLEEGRIAGTAYRSGLAELEWYQGGEYVITDEAGTPVHRRLGRYSRVVHVRRPPSSGLATVLATVAADGADPLSVVAVSDRQNLLPTARGSHARRYALESRSRESSGSPAHRRHAAGTRPA
jgi:hypothetical protein